MPTCGLGEAALAMENYQDARNAFQKAVQLNPSDAASKMQLDLSNRVLALDPNARGIEVGRALSAEQGTAPGRSDASGSVPAGKYSGGAG